MAQHQRIGLADEISFFVGGDLDRRDQGTGGGHDAPLGGAGDIGIGADELGPLVYQFNGFLDFFKAVGSGFAYHHIIRVHIVHIDALVVQRFGQGRLADDIGGAVRLLAVQKFRGGHGAGIKMVSRNLKTHPLELHTQLMGRFFGAVG